MKLKFYGVILLFLSGFILINHAKAQMKPETMQQIQSLLEEKASRTPAQKKVGSQLLQAVKESHGQKMAVNTSLDAVKLQTEYGKVKVDISLTQLTDAFISKIQSLGGKVIYPSKQFSTVRAALPLEAIEKLAADGNVKSINTASAYLLSGVGDSKSRSDKSALNNRKTVGFSDNKRKETPSLVRRRPTIAERQARIKQQVEQYVMMLGTGAINSQGDHAHRADDVRNTYGYAGQGIKIGVLSDSYNALGVAGADVLSGDLPGIGNPYGNTTPITVVADYASGADEGRAMLEIVHDLVPKSQLFFATADISEASFATNIVALRTTYGCDIIIDDVGYFDEPVFQDGIVAQAVNTITAAGGMYFSSAANSGSFSLGTGGVWEGDFSDAGSPVFTGSTKAGTIHNFGSAIAGDSILSVASGVYNLQWSDPWGASVNDYDLFLVSAAGVVKASSTTVQNGTQNPYESFAPPTLVAGDRLIVFKATGAAVRAIHLNTNRGTLRRATVGQTHGHACAAAAFGVAAAPAAGAFGAGYPSGPFPGVYTAAQGLENFTSDGPRKIFYNADGTPITAGNYLFVTNGGTTRMKPDITAADGVATTLAAGSGLNPFYGTSAAAPHAGAIAALLKSAAPGFSNAQIRNLITTTALDVLVPGYDVVSGYGIVQAYQGLAAINPTPLPYLNIGTLAVTEGSFSNGNGNIDPGETGNLVVQLKNQSLVTDPNVVATVTTTTPGVFITKGTISYGDIASGANLSNTGNPFNFVVNASVACGTVITFQIKATFTGGVGSVGYTATVVIGTFSNTTISSTLGSVPPTGTGYMSTSGQQIGRVTRTGIVSGCGTVVANPGLTVTTGSRQFDSYTFTNTSGANQCYTVNLAAANGSNLFTIAYNKAGFVPSNPSLNYVAEPGTSSTSQTYSFNVKKDSAFTVVVHDVNVLPASNSPYTLNVSYTGCAVSPSCTPIVITKTSLATGAKDTYYVQHVTATGGSGAYTDSLTGALPAGLSFAGDSLYGTPTQAGSFPITVKVTDLAGCSPSTINYTLVITGTAATSITATAGTPQSANVNIAFTTALQATVKNDATLLPGVNVIFTAPTTGASGTFSNGTNTVTVVSAANGIATAPTFMANSTQGSYNVIAHIAGVNIPDAVFALTNICPTTIVTTSSDDGPGSLRYIIANSCPNSVITFDPSVTLITLTSGELVINKPLTIQGPGANLLTISGNNASRIFNVSTGTAATSFSGMTLRNASVPAIAANGGGAFLISNGALLGAVNITGCVLTNNNVTLPGNALGGGIDNEGGIVTIDHCAITNNTTSYRGAAIQNQGFGSMIITNSTITGNTAGTAGIGGGIRSFLPLTITNCTFFGNSALTGGNISVAGDTCTLSNSIVAGGSLTATGGSGPDISTTTVLKSADYNLIQNTAGITTLLGTTTHNITGISPKLLPLANYSGAIPGLLPMSSSVVVDAGNPTLLATATDQRGFSRKVGTSADIGAIETNYVATLTSGSPQTTNINTTFPSTLAITVKESSNLIAGDSVTYTAPTTGASGIFMNGTRMAGVITNASGMAAPVFTANGTAGIYNVTGSIGSAFAPLNFALTNSLPMIAFTGCPNVNVLLARPGYNVYNNEPLSMYSLDTATGTSTIIAGGPLKDAITGKNIEVNGAGVNSTDGFIYAIRDTINTAGTAAAPLLYRIASNYGNTMLGTLPIPNLSAGENLAVVDPAAGSFDDGGNYYYIAMAGAYSFTTNTFVPSSYYIGKVSGVSGLMAGTGTLIASFTKINFSNVACVGLTTRIFSPISSSSGTSAGNSFQDMSYSNLYKSLYVYEAYLSGGSYVGQLIGINPTTGMANCYPTSSPFGAANNEVAGISTTASGNLRVFLTGGDVYKTTITGTDFTSSLTKIGASGITSPTSIRGDLATCNVGPTTLPATRSIVVSQPDGIVAYPNPTVGLTTITLGTPLNNATAHLLGAAGNVIEELSNINGTTFQMNLTGKPSGMYTVEVIQGGKTIMVKIIK